MPSTDRDRVAELLAPGLTMRTMFQRHPRAALVRAIARRLRVVLLLGGIVVITLRSAASVPFVVLLPSFVVLVVLAVVFGVRAYRVLGHGETDDMVAGRAGVWGEVTSYIRRDRVQSASIDANFFQRRRGLATLRVDVAQPLGSVSIVDMAEVDARRMLAELTARR